MAEDVIVRQHIDDFLTTTTLAGAQSTLDIRPDVYTAVASNSGAWGQVGIAAVAAKADRNNPVLTGLLSATGPVIINVNSSTIPAVRVTQTGPGDAFVVEDTTSTDTTPFVINSQGNVGIGRAPSIKFEVESSDTIASFAGTISENNGISINNDFASDVTYRLGYLDYRNENDITVSRVAGTIETNGSSDLIFSSTPSGNRSIDRKAVRLVIKGSGNVGINTSSPSARLHVNGSVRCDGSLTTTGTHFADNIQLANTNTSLTIPSSSKIVFSGPASFPSDDPIYIQRVNPGVYFGGKSELRIALGDDPQTANVLSNPTTTYTDSIVVGTTGPTYSWIPKIELHSHGLISCYGDYNPTLINPTSGSPAMPVSGAHLTTKAYVDKLTPPGAVVAFAMSAAPDGWLYCNGQQVSRQTYKSLFDAIGVTYGVGNGTTTFTLPDLRGEFVRGWDNGRNIDRDRAFASTQKGTIMVADPNLTYLNVTGIYSEYEYNNDTFAPVAGYDKVNAGDYAGVNRSSIVSTSFGALGSNAFAYGATRPRNIALYYCIKF